MNPREVYVFRLGQLAECAFRFALAIEQLAAAAAGIEDEPDPFAESVAAACAQVLADACAVAPGMASIFPKGAN